MTLQLTAAQVWEVIEKELFAVIGMVTAQDEARTVGIVYIVRDRKLYIGTGKNRWKARHLRSNPAVSVTVPIAKRVSFMPWMKIPQATITFQGKAKVLGTDEVSNDLLRAVYRHMADDTEFMADSCVIEVTPEGDFVTYGVGIKLMDMRIPEKARGRAPVK